MLLLFHFFLNSQDKFSKADIPADYVIIFLPLRECKFLYKNKAVMSASRYS